MTPEQRTHYYAIALSHPERRRARRKSGSGGFSNMFQTQKKDSETYDFVGVLLLAINRSICLDP